MTHHPEEQGPERETSEPPETSGVDAGREAVEHAEAVLLDRYDDLTPEQAAAFLEHKAREDDRDVVDVAVEVVDVVRGDDAPTGD